MLLTKPETIHALTQALSDEYSMKIILSTIPEEKSVEDLSKENDIPLSTCYRRVHECGSVALCESTFIATFERNPRGDVAGDILRARRRVAVSSMELAFVVLIIAVAAVSVVYIDSAQQTADLQNQLTILNGKLSSLQSNVGTLQSNVGGLATRLPLMNQTPTIRAIRFTWYLSPQAHQDRFEPSFPVVNQGDMVELTLIDNDTVAHDWVVGPPY